MLSVKLSELSVDKSPLSQTYKYISNVPVLCSPNAMKLSPALSIPFKSLTEFASAHGNQKAMDKSISDTLTINL